jgi:hypothetical protein
MYRERERETTEAGFLLYRIKRELRGEDDRLEGVGVIKDKELKLQETEASHTLGGDITYTSIYQSRIRNTIGHTDRRICRRAKFRLRKKTMNRCPYDNEECE